MSNPIEAMGEILLSTYGNSLGDPPTRALIEALDDAGFVIVPKVPTRKMEIAADHAFASGEPTWNALLAAGAVKP